MSYFLVTTNYAASIKSIIHLCSGVAVDSWSFFTSYLILSLVGLFSTFLNISQNMDIRDYLSCGMYKDFTIPWSQFCTAISSVIIELQVMQRTSFYRFSFMDFSWFFPVFRSKFINKRFFSFRITLVSQFSVFYRVCKLSELTFWMIFIKGSF